MDTEQNVKDAQIARGRPGKPTFIYIIGAGRGIHKVGITGNLSSRLTQYKIHSPVPVKLRFTYEIPREHARALEATAHRALAPFRSHGEWFKVSQIGATREVFNALRAHGLERVRTPEQTKADYERLMGFGRKRNYYRAPIQSVSGLNAKGLDRFA